MIRGQELVRGDAEERSDNESEEDLRVELHARAGLGRGRHGGSWRGGRVRQVSRSRAEYNDGVPMNVEEWTDEAGAANDGRKKSRVIVTRGETPC
jgi:hypothetical protein